MHRYSITEGLEFEGQLAGNFPFWTAFPWAAVPSFLHNIWDCIVSERTKRRELARPKTRLKLRAVLFLDWPRCRFVGKC